MVKRPRKRLLALCLLCAVGMSTWAQRVSFKINQKPLKTAIIQFKKATGYSFVFGSSNVNMQRKVTVNANNQPLSTVVDQMLEGQNVDYEIQGKLIVLKEKKAQNNTAPSSSTNNRQQQGKKITGTVVDKNGDPIIGATIKLIGAEGGTVTNIDGNFELRANPGQKAEVSYVGFDNQTITLDANTKVTLRENVENLNEVVVIGYGSLDKKEVTSAITSIKGSDLAVGVGGADITQSLQGKIGGLVIANNGSVNASSTLQLRGMTSINAGREPLIVIDGFPGGDIRSLSQDDIESIDVLKDASAGAIYGTRAASGVILITTKSGKDTGGKLRLSYDNEFSHKQGYREPKMLSGREFAEHQISTDYGDDVDWWDEMINHHNFSQKHHASLQYGTDKAQVYTSFYVERQEGLAIVDSRKDYGGDFNANFKLFNGWLELHPLVSYRQTSRRNHWPEFAQALRNNPTRSPYDKNDPHGFNIWLNETHDYNTVANAYEYDYKGIDKWFKPQIMMKLNIKPIPGLNYNQTLGYENRQWELHHYDPSYSASQLTANRTGTAYLGFDKTENITSEGYFSYIGEFGKHSIKGTAGYSYFEYNNESFSMENYNFSVDGIKYWDIGQGSALSDGRASMSSYKSPSEKLFSVFGRVNYAWNDTYLAGASIRHEGSSKFAKENRWANFWSVNAGWRFSNEKFMKNVEWLDDGKIRIGYGVTGNNNFGATYMANLLGSDAYWYLPTGKWAMSYGKTQNVNPNLGWEQKKEWNFGLDYSVLGGRLQGSFDYFIRNIDNLLYEVRVPVPPYTQQTQWQNIGKMQIKGWEINITGNPIRTKDWNWTSSLNMAHSSGKIKTLWGNSTYYESNEFSAPGSPGTAARIEEGTTIGQFYIWKFAGFDDDGNFLLYNKDGEVIPAAQKNSTDKQYIGNYNPKLIVSWNNTVTWKQFDFGIQMRSWIDFDVYNTIPMYYGIQGMANTNVLKDTYTKYAQIKGEKQICDYYLEDGTFLKIDNITLGYTIPMKKWTKWIQSIRLWGTIGNVCCITGYSGMNPEVNITGWDNGTEKWWDQSSFYPMSRTWTFGMQFNF